MTSSHQCTFSFQNRQPSSSVIQHWYADRTHQNYLSSFVKIESPGLWCESRKSAFLEVFQLTWRTSGLAESTENSKKTRTMAVTSPLTKSELLFILRLLSPLVYFITSIVVTIIYTLTWSPLKILINRWYSFIFLPLKI